MTRIAPLAFCHDREVEAKLHGAWLRTLLTALDAASQPGDLGQPGFGLHPLKGDRKGQWSVGAGVRKLASGVHFRQAGTSLTLILLTTISRRKGKTMQMHNPAVIAHPLRRIDSGSVRGIPSEARI